VKGKVTARISVRVAWWVWAYVAGVRFVSKVTGLEPDMAKVDAVLAKGVKAVIR